MTPVDPKYAHLKLKVLNAVYKYVLFENSLSFQQAIKTIMESVNDSPYSIFFTPDEKSAIIPSTIEVGSIKAKDVSDWACISVIGEMPFGTVEGLLATVASVLKHEGIGNCVVSTYKTDLFFVRSKYLALAKQALKDAGWEFV